MRQFHISTPNLKEPARAVYDDAGLLCSISVIGCGMNEKQITTFKALVPVKFDDLAATFAKHKDVVIVEAEFTVTFDMFWNRYDKKINKARALPLWNKLNKVEQVKAYMGLAAYDKFLSSTNWGRAKADPENYLRNRMWENEYK